MLARGILKLYPTSHVASHDLNGETVLLQLMAPLAGAGGAVRADRAPRPGAGSADAGAPGGLRIAQVLRGGRLNRAAGPFNWNAGTPESGIS